MGKYSLTVNNKNVFDLDESTLSSVDAITTGPSKFHILKDNTPYAAHITVSDFYKREYTIMVNNNAYTVTINNSLDGLIKEMGFETGAVKQVNEIKAPIPGLILEINVTEGQEVQENESLLILEAMKMENSFLSPRNGIIKSIAIKKGDIVEKGQLLIEFE